MKGSPSKLGKKSLEGDENRRASYNVCDEQSPQVSGMVCDVLDGEQRKLVPVCNKGYLLMSFVFPCPSDFLFSESGWTRCRILVCKEPGSFCW